MTNDDGIFNEMRRPDGRVRAPYAGIETWLAETTPEMLEAKRREAEMLFMRIGITFAVYGEGGDPERIIPFDMPCNRSRRSRYIGRSLMGWRATPVSTAARATAGAT